MPLTVNVGYSEKLGQPDFGSIGASCHIECELDGHLAFDDPETFQSKVHDLYAACVRAVQDQLARRNGGHAETSNPPRNGAHKPSNGAKTTSSETPSTTSNGSTKHRASKRQLDYLEQLARQVPGLGVRRLESLAQRICGKPIADFSSFDASRLIDTLKAIKAGNLDLDAATVGDAP